VASAATNQFSLYKLAVLQSGGAPLLTYGGSGAASASTFGGITDVAYDSTNDICYATDNLWNRVLVFTQCAVTSLGSRPAAKVFGQSTFTSIAASTFTNPWGVAVDSARGDLYVSDKNCKISVFSAANNMATGAAPTSTLAGSCGCSQSMLMNPKGLSTGTVNGATALIVSDYGNGRVMAWNIPAANGAPATFELGASSWTVCSPGAPVAANVLSGPSDAYVDPVTGALFVTDSLNNRVMVFDAATYVPALPNAKVAASAVVGQAALTTGTPGAGTGNLNSPNDVIYLQPSAQNPTDLLIVVDTLNNRLQSFQGNALLVTTSDTAAYYYNYTYYNYTYYYYSSGLPAASSRAAGGSSAAAGSSIIPGSSFVRPTQVTGGRRGRALKKSWKHHKRLLNQNFF
jgi:DNA-binding beta-propeller fold protein YncE